MLKFAHLSEIIQVKLNDENSNTSLAYKLKHHNHDTVYSKINHNHRELEDLIDAKNKGELGMTTAQSQKLDEIYNKLVAGGILKGQLIAYMEMGTHIHYDEDHALGLCIPIGATMVEASYTNLARDHMTIYYKNGSFINTANSVVNATEDNPIIKVSINPKFPPGNSQWTISGYIKAYK